MTCSHDDCKEPARWRPALELRARKGSEPRLARFTQLAYCDQHRASLGIETFLSDEGFVKLVKHVREAGLAAPSKQHTTLTWVKLTPEEMDTADERQQQTTTPVEDLAF